MLKYNKTCKLLILLMFTISISACEITARQQQKQKINVGLIKLSAMSVKSAIDRALINDQSASSLEEIGLKGFENDSYCDYEVLVGRNKAELTCWLKNNKNDAWVSWTKENGKWSCEYNISPDNTIISDCVDVS